MKKGAIVFFGALSALVLAAVALDALGQPIGRPIARDPRIPDSIYEMAERFEGFGGLELVKEPSELGGPNFVARVVLQPLRAGYKACPDHYPARFVENDASCPSLRDGDPPSPGWTACYNAFYAPAEIGCPPQPPEPLAPATTPPPRCSFGPEACGQEAPGGPVLIRALRAATPATAAAPGLVGTAPATAAAPAAIGAPPATAVSPPVAAERPDRLATRRLRERARAAPGARAAPPAPAAPAARAAPAAPASPAEPLRPVRAAQIVDLARLQLRKPPAANVRPLCRGGDCRWGGDGNRIALPTPPVVPYKHVPCEYQYVSFFVPENRYCPREDLGERPAPGAALYVSWQAAGDAPPADGAPERAPPELYYHRDDFDGISRTIRQILGSSDDRYAMSEATALERAAARSTAVLIDKDYVTDEGDGMVSLRDDPSWPALCSTERFAGLPRPGRCSGVKIGDRLVATSAHCVRNARQCAETSVVFGYYGEGDARTVVNSDDVYQCKAIVASRRPAAIGERGADWTIFEVDRDIDAPSATLADSTNVHPSVVTTVIGYPLGLPAIVTRLGVVQTATTEYFIANSDTFIGNSGSAVFAAQSIEDSAPRVLGLLTGGRYDFVDSREGGAECVQAKWCRDADCLGDDVVYTDDLIRALSAYPPQN